ncbi:DUF3110 domain-containing protein [Microcoleus sp. FACHB-1515]|uniref:DUF3110 domain-containing protein n=1 Tax=Cyanophyceae TaxID=3028117 RepID=UPI0016863EEA|nr:DUF3110 domain-containing protein [Microcoleus sp. FACHB-1515]MBD2092894.1 DUF3110 domain-containing protein [Microcoleus sp. FACHB-1515]
MRVYVLLFNARTDNEGIHSLHMNDRDVVLMFESEDDATRFGLMLEAQDFPTPSVEAIDSEEIEEFCESAGFDCKLVPIGSLFMPPEATVEETDWQVDRPVNPETADSETEITELTSSELDRIRKQLEGLL